MWLNTGMKSLHKIISEVSLLEARTNTTAAQNAQVAANVQAKKPRYVLTEKREIQHPVTGNKVVLRKIKFTGKDSKLGLGGWIESTDNLTMKGSAWISEDAMVFGGAKVLEDAQISGPVVIFGDAEISGNAAITASEIGACAVASGKHNTDITDKIIGIKESTFKQWALTYSNKLQKNWQNDLIYNDKASYVINTDASGEFVTQKYNDPDSEKFYTLFQIKSKKDGKVGGWIEDDDNLFDNAWVEDGAVVFGMAKVYGNAIIGKNAVIYGNAVIGGTSKVGEGAIVSSGEFINKPIEAKAVIHAQGKEDRDAIIEKLRAYKKIPVDGKKYTFTGKKKTVKNLSKKKGLVKTVASKVGIGSEELEDGAMITVWQIKRIEDGSLGGWVQHKEKDKLNLSQEGRSWLTEDAVAYGNAIITGDALVIGNSVIYDDAVIEGLNTVVSDSKIGGSTVIKNKDIDGVTVAKMGALKKAAIGAVAGAAYAQSKGLLF